MTDPTAEQLEIRHLRLEVARLQGALTSAKLLAALLSPPPPVLPPLNLTPRNREVLVRLIAGDSNEQIAEHLYMALGTVKSHMRSLAKQFGTRNRTGTLMAAMAAGFTPDKEGLT